MMQPFASDLDANFLGWINRLARIDRHRTLVDGACYLAEFRPALAIEHGRQATLQWGSRVVRGPVTDIARVTVTPWDEDAVVKFNPRSGIDPEIDQWSVSHFWGPKRFGDRVAMLPTCVAGEIAVYEYDCRGTSRREDMLTGSFRQECDTPGPLQAAGQGRRSRRTVQCAGRTHTDHT
jgi:hypothetical protein